MFFAKLTVVLAFALCSEAEAAPPTGISGPYSHDGLSVFLIQRSAAGWVQGARASVIRYLTLEQAMTQKKVVVHETGQVNDVAVENISAEPVFLQAGDIVKGGRQDRMVTNDFVLPPRSGKLPLAAFCVEQGRWRPRGSEPARAFSTSTELAAVRFEPKSMWNQMSVWQKVVELQEALASRLRKDPRAAGLSTGLSAVRDAASPTSLMLTQASRPVEEAVSGYTKALSGLVREETNAVGYVFAINGALKNADLYASPQLFAAMWPKLLKSAALEAVRQGPSRAASVVDASTVLAFVREPRNVPETTTVVARKTKLIQRDGSGHAWEESRDGDNWVHRSVVAK